MINGYESLNNIIKALNENTLYVEYLTVDLIVIRKIVQALEIIKDKRVDVDLLITSSNVESYNFRMPLVRELEQNEYDLLKEVLSHEQFRKSS